MLSSTADYALRAILFLARHHGTAQRANDIARATGAPQNYMAKTLNGSGGDRLLRRAATAPPLPAWRLAL
jgi:DNA-binding IscR family transcriptional regulator